MENLISKELLGELFNVKIKDCYIKKSDVRYIEYLEDMKDYIGIRSINIYELANKCKEWAEEKGYYTMSGTWALENGKQKACILGKPKPLESFIADTEYEAIFKACQWILDNKA